MTLWTGLWHFCGCAWANSPPRIERPACLALGTGRQNIHDSVKYLSRCIRLYFEVRRRARRDQHKFKVVSFTKQCTPPRHSAGRPSTSSSPHTYAPATQAERTRRPTTPHMRHAPQSSSLQLGTSRPRRRAAERSSRQRRLATLRDRVSMLRPVGNRGPGRQRAHPPR